GGLGCTVVLQAVSPNNLAHWEPWFRFAPRAECKRWAVLAGRQSGLQLVAGQTLTKLHLRAATSSSRSVAPGRRTGATTPQRRLMVGLDLCGTLVPCAPAPGRGALGMNRRRTILIVVATLALVT